MRERGCLLGASDHQLVGTAVEDICPLGGSSRSAMWDSDCLGAVGLSALPLFAWLFR